MIKLHHKATSFSEPLSGIRKVVMSEDQYIESQTILFIEHNKTLHSDIDMVITTSKEFFKTHSNKKILYFEKISEIEENAIVRLEHDTLYLTFLPSSNAHTLFFTKKCNHYCLMCSEPPSTKDDSYLVDENIQIVNLLNPELKTLGISGGEPTLNKKDFLKVVTAIRKALPDTEIRVLTNGRAFTDKRFVTELSQVAQGYLVFEIPVYHHNYAVHDYIVQSKNAFFETVEGIYNCAQENLQVEIRVVLTKLNYDGLEDLMYFIYRNIPFVNHIALMGLEYIGFAMNNFEEIHISPLKYQQNLINAINDCKKYNLLVSIYNLPLCLVHDSLRGYARQSISDWKNEFSIVCNECDYKSECAGMFTSTQPHFENLLQPIIKEKNAFQSESSRNLC